MEHPTIIQGGMGVAVSGWRLARTVSRTGQLGVVSGTALDTVLVRQLQDGDPGGHHRRAMARFPIAGVADRVLETYFVEGGKGAEVPYALVPKPRLPLKQRYLELLALSNFVEVTLAKEGHDGQVGINFLEKIQIPTLASLYGAMLAEVDYVLMGAGIPREIPGAMDAFAEGRKAELSIYVQGAQKGEVTTTEVDPAALGWPTPPKRPYFLAIVASVSLATMLSRKATGHVDGFVIERETAGGHNAPPRGKLQLSESGEPIYGPRDVVDLEQIHHLGRPFWLAGACASPQSVAEVQAFGGQGVQIGTTFALSRESGLHGPIRDELLRRASADRLKVRTDARASPTGFPFKVVEIEDSIAEDSTYRQRQRVCDLGYLRTVFRKENGGLGYRCASEPIKTYVAKGGLEEDTEGRRCLCNALLATVDMPQALDDGSHEIPIVTSGDDYSLARKLLLAHGGSYSATQVIDYLLGREPAVETEGALVAEPGVASDPATEGEPALAGRA